MSHVKFSQELCETDSKCASWFLNTISCLAIYQATEDVNLSQKPYQNLINSLSLTLAEYSGVCLSNQLLSSRSVLGTAN